MEKVDVKRIMKTIKKQGVSDDFTNLKEINEIINKHIKKRAKNKEYLEDIEKINSLNICIIPNKSEVPEKENEEENLSYINRNAKLPEPHFQQPSKGVFNLIIRPIRKRLVLETSFIIERILSFQNNFNIQNLRFLNAFKKRVDNKLKSNELKINTNENRIREHEIKIKNTQIKLKNDENIIRDNELRINNNEKGIKEIYYPDLEINYKRFEDLHRGKEKDILKTNSQFLRFFKDSSNVLDIGCGRGEFLELLKKIKVNAVGIDIDENMIDECRAKKLNVIKRDAITHLFSVKDESLDGIFCNQLLEHLNKKDIVTLLRLSSKKLIKGKFAVFTTPNIKNLTTFVNSLYMDPTHITPLHPYTLKFLCEEAGFSKVEFIFYSNYKKSEKLQKTRNKTENKNIEKLNELLFSAQDYAVICTK